MKKTDITRDIDDLIESWTIEAETLAGAIQEEAMTNKFKYYVVALNECIRQLRQIQRRYTHEE